MALTDDNCKRKFLGMTRMERGLKASEWVMIKWNPNNKQFLRTSAQGGKILGQKGRIINSKVFVKVEGDENLWLTRVGVKRLLDID